MIIMAKKLENSLINDKFKKKYDTLGIPKITEKNLHQILDLAKQLKVPWWYLMNINFDLLNVQSKGFALHWGVGNQLELEATSPHGPIIVGLVREKFNQRKKSEHLLKIEEAVKKYSRIA